MQEPLGRGSPCWGSHLRAVIGLGGVAGSGLTLDVAVQEELAAWTEDDFAYQVGGSNLDRHVVNGRTSPPPLFDLGSECQVVGNSVTRSSDILQGCSHPHSTLATGRDTDAGDSSADS